MHDTQSETSMESLKRVKFTPKEDEILINQVAISGPRKWSRIALNLPGRTPRQCRDRYVNYLSAGLQNGPWTHEEDTKLLNLYNKYGSKWALIQKSFPKRSSNNIKNRWHTFPASKKPKIKTPKPKPEKKAPKEQPKKACNDTDIDIEQLFTDSPITDNISEFLSLMHSYYANPENPAQKSTVV